MVELDAVLVVKTVFFGLTCIILRLMGGAIQPTQSAEFQSD